MTTECQGGGGAGEREWPERMTRSAVGKKRERQLAYGDKLRHGCREMGVGGVEQNPRKEYKLTGFHESLC